MSWHRRNPHTFLSSLLQFALGSYTQNWIKHETDCCKKRTFYSSFFVPIFRKYVTQWQTETAPIRCNFISAMMSSTFSLPNSKHPAWKACQPFYAKLNVSSVSLMMTNMAVLWSPIISSSISSYDMISRSSWISNGESLAPQEIKIDFAVLPVTKCQ